MDPESPDSLSVLYQSADFVVVNKRWDLRLDSKLWPRPLTLQAQLNRRFPDLADPGTCHGFRFCHQLDFSTSGALCVALNRAAAGRAYRCFKERTVTKAYVALVRGHVGEDRMTISHAIGKNTAEGLTHTMCIQGTEGCENAKPCRTELWVLEHGTYGGEPVTKVLLQPLTGRTHQLRVHCSASGHPIVGDLTYGLGRDGVPFRMMLHALHLRIPTGPELVEATAPDPFLPSLDSRWVSLRAVRPLGAVLRTLRAAGDGAPAAGRSGTSGRPVGVTDGAERQCRAWLREWAAALEPDG
ncbi:RNA pseudouridylate synthase domain-containing protein 1 isoform X2 [Tachyglossus aculeatus]|uniref:RNA pseudouridylate synthase domain-containing protein 1 isoform X2 n=1 Tax=Tachyglossus aculeatus TaxID=9261 RepID=UPI0018F5B39E|nr:RNA pseudouridylate synthase domain-containing protein 1 isoform X2 [Tachyglossus aculeatus]XP_038619123.1 RNA pseudouridylate synthase domain-containing protein 1 isoform X2 [Tachyglossus aculeatus]